MTDDLVEGHKDQFFPALVIHLRYGRLTDPRKAAFSAGMMLVVAVLSATGSVRRRSALRTD
jgi:hypothetical protein